ncbi:MAG: hypothetical protein SU899_04745 [Chloroflexota bacterium]|nr:hypothetical protein [Chloroflexota bacterium]
MKMKACLLIMVAMIMLLVTSCTAPTENPVNQIANHLPVITSVKAERDAVLTLESCQIKCIALDEDSDVLSYEWSASKGEIDGNDRPTVIWIAPEIEGIFRITVRVTDGKGGEVTDSTTITVRVNRPPRVTSLIADVDWLTSSRNCQVECSASDPDGDELSYEWSTNGGDISGTGSIVTWTASDAEGLYNIAVVVSDSHGGEDTRSLIITVAPNPPPIIEAMVVTPKEPKYLKEAKGGYRILKGKSCEIECSASDPEGDELSHEWTTDGGSISGEGPVITWTAPKNGGKVTVTVTVSDSRGGVASKSVVFNVKICAACSFK